MEPDYISIIMNCCASDLQKEKKKKIKPLQTFELMITIPLL